MSTLNDVVINKLSGGLGRRMPDQDMVSGLLFNGVETKEGLSYDSVYRLASVADAVALGITLAYDAGGQSAYYQIEQYFRMNPSGDLYIMLVNADSYENVVVKAMAFQEKTKGAIRQMAAIFTQYEVVISKGDEVSKSSATPFEATKNAVRMAKSQTELAFTNYMPFEIFLEGKGFDMRAPESLVDLKAENVSVVVAMDVEKGSESNYENTAAVGVFLGAVSKAKVSENVAWVEKFNLSGLGFSKAGLIGGVEIHSQADMRTLNENRYVFARTHTGLAGIYFNDSHTCIEGTSDFAFVENNRTINKATRLLRATLLPKLASPILVDIDGYLPQSVSKSFEGLCRAALEGMLANQEISDFEAYVDPKQNILATSELSVKAEIIPVGTARRITVNLGFKNPFGIDKK